MERHLDHGRYTRALRAARRTDDPGLRLAAETSISDQLLALLEGGIRVRLEPSDVLQTRLGVLPPVFVRSDAVFVRLEVSVSRAAPVPMSFRVVGLTASGKRYLRTDQCAPVEAVGLACSEWLAGAPLVPRCEGIATARGERAAAALMRWMSGGLVNVPARGAEAPPVCARSPLSLAPEDRESFGIAAQRLEEELATVPPRAVAGRTYARRELLYAASDRDERHSLTLQVAFHVDHRAPPLRASAVVALPAAATVDEALSRVFERPRRLSVVFRPASRARAHPSR
ncbi:MAG: hypothetical protein H5U40_12160 [Polyangiaceae bacterium]|nr:hypothetical protein [Polyangiaceae bacterium]